MLSLSPSNISYTIPQCCGSQPWPHIKITWGALKKKYQDSGLTAQRVGLNRFGVEFSIGVCVCVRVCVFKAPR